MLKSGIFITPEEVYSVFEIIESGFYRIDFLKSGAAFQVDHESVVYSMVRRKNVSTLGDSSIYDKYLLTIENVESANIKTTKESNWVNGVYTVTVTGTDAKRGYMTESISENGNVVSSVRSANGYTVQMSVIDPVYGVKLDPLNFSMYTTTSLSKDTIVDSDNGLFYPLSVLKRRHDIAHLDSCDYVVATSILEADARLKMFEEDPYPFRGFDTETTGLDVCIYGEDKLVGVILGHNTTTATYFPFRHTTMDNLPLSYLDRLMSCFQKFEDRAVAHNKKFDRQVMLKEGYDMHIKWDTMQLSIIYNPVRGKGIHSEKTLAYELMHKKFLELDDIFVNSKDINFAVLPKDIVGAYACPDGTNPLLLLEDFFNKIPKFQYKLMEIECDLCDVKADQEYYGIRVDTKKFEKQYQNCNYILDTLLDAFRKLTREDGNINSAPVLNNLLYNKMHCKVLLRTPSGQPSTSMAAIKKLAKVPCKHEREAVSDIVDLNGKVVVSGAELAKSAYPALVILAKYREFNKLKTAFYSRFERTMKTGRIFFWVNQNGAATGRQSSPMHQLPPELKEIILADADDRDFWGPDFSQIELRMIAYLAGEKELIELAKDPDNDIHRIIGSLISNKEMWAITPEERSTGKRRNFGVVYLISARGLAAQIFGPGFTTENVKFCQNQLDEFYHKFKRIDRYIKRNAMLVQKRGYMETAWYHRRRLFNEVFDPSIEPSTLASILRMGNNVPVQGTAADYLKLAECQMDKFIRLKGWNKLKNGFPMVRMMLSIHDEIIISADNSIPYEEIIEMITLCMETPVDGAPPFFVQPARMDNWEGHSDDACAMPIRLRDEVIKNYNETKQSVFKQSYFQLQVPDDVVATINNSKANTVQLVMDFVDKVSLRFDHGDYVTEYTEEHKKDALKKYVESGFTSYRIDNYLDVLNGFRQKQLQDYMSDLINKYGMDYEQVGAHVRHPSLTFALLDTYGKKIPKDMEHVDRITEAAKLWIEDVKAGKHAVSTEFKADLNEKVHVATDKEKFGEELTTLVNFDNNGEIIFEDESDAEDGEYAAYYIDDPDDVIDRCNNKPVYVWELADCIVFDVQDLHQQDVDRVLSYIFTHKNDDGFFNVNIIYNNTVLETGMCVENLDIEEANNMLVQMANKEVL